MLSHSLLGIVRYVWMGAEEQRGYDRGIRFLRLRSARFPLTTVMEAPLLYLGRSKGKKSDLEKEGYKNTIPLSLFSLIIKTATQSIAPHIQSKQQTQPPPKKMTTSTTEYTNTRVLISKIPEGVAPNKDHFKTITVKETKPVLEEGSVFVKNVIFSLDPCTFIFLSLTVYDLLFVTQEKTSWIVQKQYIYIYTKISSPILHSTTRHPPRVPPRSHPNPCNRLRNRQSPPILQRFLPRRNNILWEPPLGDLHNPPRHRPGPRRPPPTRPRTPSVRL